MTFFPCRVVIRENNYVMDTDLIGNAGQSFVLCVVLRDYGF